MEGLDKSLSFAEGMIHAEEANSQIPTGEKYCLNCSTILEGIYCHRCGQKDIPKRQTLGELLINFISSFWSYESKFFQTGKYLIFKPGFLAIEYTQGKRERYFHPARMYVFISFVYFLLFTTLPDQNEPGPDETNKSTENISYGTPFSIMDSIGYKSLSQYDSIQQSLPAEKQDGWLTHFLQVRQIEITEKYQDNGDAFAEAFADSFSSNFSKIFFFLLPVFALVLKLLYIRRDFFYSEHLVFSIYYYNFFFLAGSFYMVLDVIPWMGWAAIFVGFWIAIYLVMAMKKMYRQSWTKTIFKYGAFIVVFAVFVGVGLLVNLIITLLFI